MKSQEKCEIEKITINYIFAKCKLMQNRIKIDCFILKIVCNIIIYFNYIIL